MKLRLSAELERNVSEPEFSRLVEYAGAVILDKLVCLAADGLEKCMEICFFFIFQVMI